MEIPLATKNIVIRTGFMGYKRKSSTFSPKTDVVGLSALKNYSEWLQQYTECHK